jgi:hypothetical protein
MSKKVLNIILLATLLMPISIVNASSGTKDSNEELTYPGYKIVTEQEEVIIEQKNSNKIKHSYDGEGIIFYPTEEQKEMAKKKKAKNNKTDNSGDINIMGPVYEDGTTKVVSVTPYANGTLIQEERKQGIAENIWYNGMKVAGVIFNTVGGIITDLATYYVDTVDKSKGTDTYTFKSYRYIGK